jgi:hypothetical protein
LEKGSAYHYFHDFEISGPVGYSFRAEQRLGGDMTVNGNRFTDRYYGGPRYGAYLAPGAERDEDEYPAYQSINVSNFEVDLSLNVEQQNYPEVGLQVDLVWDGPAGDLNPAHADLVEKNVEDGACPAGVYVSNAADGNPHFAFILREDKKKNETYARTSNNINRVWNPKLRTDRNQHIIKIITMY